MMLLLCEETTSTCPPHQMEGNKTLEQGNRTGRLVLVCVDTGNERHLTGDLAEGAHPKLERCFGDNLTL